MAADIRIFTDGSALGNPGRGGYGIVLLSGPHRKELSQGFRLTTNNRMELMAVCVALEALRFRGSNVTVFSDSKYVVEAVNKNWLAGSAQASRARRTPTSGCVSCASIVSITCALYGSRVTPPRWRITAAMSLPWLLHHRITCLKM